MGKIIILAFLVISSHLPASAQELACTYFGPTPVAPKPPCTKTGGYCFCWFTNQAFKMNVEHDKGQPIVTLKRPDTNATIKLEGLSPDQLQKILPSLSETLKSQKVQ